METQELKEALAPKKKKKPNVLRTKDLLSTGSTLLNLALTGRVQGGFAKGLYYRLVGDSESGKTWLALTCFAEATMNSNFDGYRFIYDNAEDGALMDVEHFFGKKLAESIEPPAKDEHGPVYSSTVEEFYYHVDDAKKQGTPFIYVLDSIDTLSSTEELKKFQEHKKAHKRKMGQDDEEPEIGEDGEVKKAKDPKGDYGDGKAKKNSRNLRQVLCGHPSMRRMGSILIIVSQTRDNLGFGFEEKTSSGGRALKFLATAEMWSSVVGQVKKKIRKKDRPIGIIARLKIKKNRGTGQKYTMDIPILRSYGIDDLGSCIDFLLSEGHWSKTKKGVIDAPEFEFSGKKDQLITLIEENEQERDLRVLVEKVWNEIEEASILKRKKRYE